METGERMQLRHWGVQSMDLLTWQQIPITGISQLAPRPKSCTCLSLFPKIKSSLCIIYNGVAYLSNTCTPFNHLANISFSTACFASFSSSDISFDTPAVVVISPSFPSLSTRVDLVQPYKPRSAIKQEDAFFRTLREAPATLGFPWT